MSNSISNPSMNSCAHPSQPTGQLIVCHGFRSYGLQYLVCLHCFHWFLNGPANTKSKQSISNTHQIHWWTHGFRCYWSGCIAFVSWCAIDFSMALPIQNRSQAWAKHTRSFGELMCQIQIHRWCIGSFIMCHWFWYYGLDVLVIFMNLSLVPLWHCMCM